MVVDGVRHSTYITIFVAIMIHMELHLILGDWSSICTHHVYHHLTPSLLLDPNVRDLLSMLFVILNNYNIKASCGGYVLITCSHKVNWSPNVLSQSSRSSGIVHFRVSGPPLHAEKLSSSLQSLCPNQHSNKWRECSVLVCTCRCTGSHALTFPQTDSFSDQVRQEFCHDPRASLETMPGHAKCKSSANRILIKCTLNWFMHFKLPLGKNTAEPH